MNDLIGDFGTQETFLPPCVEGGSGVHNWVFRAAKICYGLGKSPKDAATLIESRMSRAPMPWNEVDETIRRAYDDTQFETSVRWPEVDWDRIKALESWSPAALNPPTATQALQAMFPGDPLVCVGASTNRCFTEKLSDFSDLECAQFVVPSPMSARYGVPRSGGRRSARTLDNTGPRKYLVIECDFTPEQAADIGRTTQEACLAVISHLSAYEDLVCVVDSAGKSVHGWFVARGEPISFMQYAVALGADKKTWTKNQLVRLPGGLRDNGKRQEILFWNPQ